MDGYSSIGTWEAVAAVLWLASVALLLVAVPVTIGGLVWWLVRHRFPSNWFVRACMVAVLAIPAAWFVGSAVNWVFDQLDKSV